MHSRIPSPFEIDEENWIVDHPLNWEKVNFLENLSGINFEILKQERERSTTRWQCKQ
jgi:hypothetical protein